MSKEDEIKRILALPENWDEKGAPAFKKETVDRAEKALSKMEQILKEHDLNIGQPVFYPCSNGSIDLHWRNKKQDYELLLNVPPAGKIDYYGRGKGWPELEGTIEV